MKKMHVTIEYDEPSVSVRALSSRNKVVTFTTEWDYASAAASRVLAAAADYLTRNREDIVIAMDIDHHAGELDVCLTLVVETDG